MRNRKQQKSVDKAIVNLLKYADQKEWATRQEEFFDELLSEAAKRLDVEVEHWVQLFGEHGYMDMIFGYLFEVFANTQWNNEPDSLIGDYIKRRGWREAPYAIRYLKALDDSQVELWEVVSVKAGHHVDVRLFGGTDKPVRINERSGSQDLKPWDCVAARVIALDGDKVFGGSLLPFSPEEAREIPLMMDRACERSIKMLEDFRAEENIIEWPDDEIRSMAREETDEHFEDILINIWINNVYKALTKPMPTILNRDGDHILMSKVTFPVERKNVDAIIKKLNSILDLDYDEINNEWSWLGCDADKVPEHGTSLLGHISLGKKELELRVNSVRRAEEGQAYLNKILKGLVGAPLALHENIESFMEGHSQDEASISEPLNAEFMTTYLDQHYRNVLDESVPALNDNTPRQCALQTNQREMLVQWLKGLENSTAGVPGMACYDFKWMWEELGLSYMSEEPID